MSEWISVADRLPSGPSEDVLVYTKEYGLDFGWMMSDGDWYIGNRQDFTVTHWMPLPEPPKEDKPS